MNYSTLGIGSADLMSLSHLTSTPNYKFYPMFMNWKVFISKMHSAMYYILLLGKIYVLKFFSGNFILVLQAEFLPLSKIITNFTILSLSIYIDR